MHNLNPTPYPMLNALLLEWVSSVQAILEDNFTGAYLQGSLAIGDFDEHSDIDFLVVTEKEIAASQLSHLQSLHARIYRLGGRYRPDCPVKIGVLADDHWETSLEGSYFTQDMLKRKGAVCGYPWYLPNGSPSLESADHCDTLVTRWTVRERGVTLSGPDPKRLIDPIPADALRLEVIANMHRIEDGIFEAFWNSGFGQPYAVLTYCRMLQTLETGLIHSKREAALWGQGRLEERWAGLIQRAWEARGHVHVSEPAEEEEFKRTLSFIRYALTCSVRHLTLIQDSLRADRARPSLEA